MSQTFKKSFLIICLIFLICNVDTLASSKSQNNFQSIKEYLKNLSTLEASFIQISGDGEIKKGKIFFNLPGKLRIEYSEPDNLLITSNGFWLTIQDTKLKQTNNYPLDRTPLDLFLNKKFNFENNHNIKFNIENEVVTVTFLGIKQQNLSKFKLQFYLNPLRLKKWVIIDEFQTKTSVTLQNMKMNIILPNKLFIPDFYNE